MPKIGIIGTTSWGITLGVMLARKKVDVRLWARTDQEAAQLTRDGPGSVTVPPGFKFPPSLSVTSSLRDALKGAQAVILAVPSQSMRHNIRLAAEYLEGSTLIVSAAKGLESDSGKRMSQVIADEIQPRLMPNICVLSGPNLAQEIIDNRPAATVVAAEKETAARKMQKFLTTPTFCVYTHTDVTGVELGGSLKNIIALGAGIADGLGYGDNAKAALITRGLTEMTALGVALGANPLTFSGLAGLGDLIATCASTLSRNHYVGMELTKGRPLQEITTTMVGVAEGVTTTPVVYRIARQMGLAMPITEAMHRVLYEGANPCQAAVDLMGAHANHELAGRKWRLFSFLRRRPSRSR
ncbi:MAG: NAD(P)-dependent glycerol-3-phosphate dehydrogenase [Chloroflexi bacterium]|nr:NAD(P)-dependent glycerol-3-phosphate dehydrogenase [Chloroflexota bacterium]